ncbi:hypothetical protein BU24DRAFT_416207 [Aaosphaeria arxii CBS 175.79]|uniref:DUF7907 domain-containing protein n=1 Tax=Aaosphaeria arxii CBS 175.79 TaxID=1450172 RepID=A0A6A5Y706_9PLEO|nr:uncharacterized protein BU24DRAFT_416207 [Aaosphaeria arxii CBS 175.79]KAF2020531.1 hypothetical protein BU24DRAFT_416207 [Aaosphaeria arxii CBS 175.79]
MKFSVPALALAFATVAVAQFDEPSAPFYLVLESDDASVNSKTLTACHEGAAIEGLCLSDALDSYPTGQAPSTFRFNSSSNIDPPAEGLGRPGYLTYLLIGNDFEVSSGLQFFADPSTNVGHPQFYPGPDGAQTLAFDTKNYLTVQTYVDDTVTPPKPGDFKAIERWFACTTYSQSYTNDSLNWVYGKAEPQNPSCKAVRVKRIFTGKRAA